MLLRIAFGSWALAILLPQLPITATSFLAISFMKQMIPLFTFNSEKVIYLLTVL